MEYVREREKEDAGVKGLENVRGAWTGANGVSSAVATPSREFRGTGISEDR